MSGIGRRLLATGACAALLIPAAVQAQCTNCTTTSVGGKTIHTWTAGSGTFTPPVGVTTVEVLVVGGGGGGGFPIDRTGGGGGAGGLIYNTSFAVSGTVAVTVGAGGNGGTSGAGATAGQNSVFGSLTAVGGGRGGTGPAAGGVFATAGGSGGGGYHNPADSGKAGTAGQGNAGGSGYDSGNVTVGFRAGGGGGAGSAGTTATSTVNGAGGDGVQNSISGTARFYAGGGGGGIQVFTGTSPGGSGVGGDGRANGLAGTNGTANRGGGGGGGSQNINTNATGNGGNGGSGVVIVRYTAPTNYFSRANGNWSSTATWSTAGCGGAQAGSIPDANSNVTICNGDAVTVNVAAQALSVDLQTGGSATSLTHNAGISLTVGAGGVTMDGGTGGSQTKAWNINAGSAIVNGPVNMNGGSNNNRIVRINLTTGTLDINGDLTMTAGDDERAVIAATGAASIFVSGDFNANNGTLTPGPSSTFTYDGPNDWTLAHSPQIQYRNLVINKPGATTTVNASTLTVLGNLDVQAGTMNVGTATIAVGGDTSVSGTLGITSTSGSETFSGNVTINSGGTWNNSANEPLTMGADLVNNGTFNSGTGTYTFSGSGQFAGSQPIPFDGAVTVNAGVTRTNNTTVSIVGNLTGGSGTSTWVNAAGSTLNVGAAVLTTGVLTASANGNTVNYNGAGNQTVKLPSGNDYYNLTLSTGGTKTPSAGTYNVGGNLLVDTGATFQLNSNDPTLNVTGSTTIIGTFSGSGSATATYGGDLTVNGTFTGNGGGANVQGNFIDNGVFTSGNGTYTFNGGAAQTLSGTTSSTIFANLALDNANGLTLTGTHDVSIATRLTLTTGPLSTGTNVVITTAACPASILRTSGWVAGFLRVTPPTTGTVTCILHLGDATSYRPVSITFTTLSAPAGAVTGWASQAPTNSPNIGTSTFDPAATATRYWVLANTARFASATATFTYSTDLASGADESSFVVGRFAAGAWSNLPTIPGTGNVTATGLTGAGGTNTLDGEFQVGEQGPFAHWRMDQFSWNGTANEVVDSGNGGPFHGTAGGLVTKAATSGVSPAIPGSPGTCFYGAFNRSNKDYVSVNSSFPNLMSASGSFTVSAWIRTTDNTQSGQRIFLDDENNTGTGGWGFSLGDSGTAGALRFFYRQPTVFLLDTGGVIANNNWYYVALVVSLASGANASRATIFVYSTGGAQLALVTNTFTWTAGSDPGPASIGGETNSAGENSGAFGFSGSIDEVRVYRQALSATQVNRIRQDARPCATPPIDHVRLEHSGIGLTCEPATMTIKACADASCSTLYNASSVTANLSPSGWIGGDSLTFTSQATIQLKRTAPGLVTLGGVVASPTPTNPNVRCFDGAVETCSFEFKDSGFLFGAIDNQVAGTTSTSSYTIQAVRKDNLTGACTGIFSGNVPGIELASECVNPSSCQAGQQVVFNNNGSGSIAANNAGAVSSYSTRTIAFGASSTATYTLSYPDVGSIRLYARYNVPDASGSPSGNFMSGNSAAFVVKPASFAVDPASVKRTADGFSNPGAAGAGGGGFAKAGEQFSAKVTALNSAGIATPNFGKELLPEGVKLAAALVAPAGGNAPSLSNASAFGAFSSGVATGTTFSWPEVGIITLTPSLADGDYLGAGDVVGSASGNVGRFYPHHFTLTSGDALNPSKLTNRSASSCSPASDFSYMNEGIRITFTLEARNSSNGVTANYTGAFAKLDLGTIANLGFGASAGATDFGALGRVDTASSSGVWSAGAANASALVGIKRRTVAPIPDGPYTGVQFRITPDVVEGGGGSPALDNVRLDVSPGPVPVTAPTTTEVRFGRLRVQNALASSGVVALPAPFEIQYWDGATSFFKANTADSCTALTTASIGLSSGATSVQAITFGGGIGTIRLAPPGAAFSGSVTVTPDLAAKPYLQGSWTNSASWSENPSATATWGIFGSQPRNFIFQRENF